MAKERTKPPVVTLSELKTDGFSADCFALLLSKTRNLTREQKPFYSCQFRDANKTVAAVVWSDAEHFADCETNWKIGVVYKLRVVYGEHPRYGPQVEILSLRPAVASDSEDGFDEQKFYERSKYDSELMYADILKLAETHLSAPLRTLVETLYCEHADALKVLPASPRNYYPFPGGWLEHVRNVSETVIGLCESAVKRYPNLRPFNSELVLAGAMLHEIGRVRELIVVSPHLPAETTVAGHLFGMVHLSRDLIRDAARLIEDFPPELLQLLEHLVLSFLVRPEWGSPRLPMIPEVLILHHADDLDAKFEMYARCLERDTSDGPVTARDPVLGKALLKDRTL